MIGWIKSLLRPATARKGASMEEAMKKEVAELIAAAVKEVTDQVGQIAAAVKPVSALVSEVEALKKSTPPAVKAEDLQKLVGEALTASQAAAAQDAARAAVIAKDLADVPAVYLGKLGNDPAKFETQVAEIRGQYAADLAKAGVKAAPVTSDAGKAASPAALGDTSKLSGAELIALGVTATAANPPATPPITPTTSPTATAKDGAAAEPSAGGQADK